ncbi:MAG: DUF2804 domain-containing protein [Devosia sp.]|nr:DUF2804 domain-containing protein [Devosia sp.]
MQHEVTSEHDLLDQNGNLIEPGWARRPLQHYNREAVAHPADRIKEWNYFFFGDEQYGIGLSMADVGAFHRLSCAFLDFKNDWQVNNMAFSASAEGAVEMTASPYGDVHFRNDQAEGHHRYRPNGLDITVRFKNFSDGNDLIVDVSLETPPGDSIEHAFHFAEEPGLFFHCHKQTCIRVSGTVRLGDLTHTYDPASAYAVKDWGRGVWPRHTTPYWGAANAVVDGKDFGFNIGYRYSDVEPATENVIFYDGVAHKLEHVVFHIQDNETAWMKPWTFTSSDGRFEMTMEPVLDRSSVAPKDIKYSAVQHQTFGYFSGTVILDDGRKLKIDRAFGFAEKLINDW